MGELSGGGGLPLSASAGSGRRYWWVNQNQTYKDEVPGGFLWSPKTNVNGARNQFYDNMELVAVGDVVFSFCDTLIKAVGLVHEPAVSAPKPNFRSGGANWLNDGWFVEVEFSEVGVRVRPKDHISEIAPLLAKKYAPLQQSGSGLQSVYLAEVSAELAAVLFRLCGLSRSDLELELDPAVVARQEIDDFVATHPALAPTERERLVKARLGQGVFKSNVRLQETACRVTGTTDISHLRASHIKPWCDSTNQEKLDGANGLLLAPHVDHLFDRGWISFADSGDLLVSSALDASVLAQWKLPTERNVGSFTTAQAEYLAFHRREVFRMIDAQ